VRSLAIITSSEMVDSQEVEHYSALGLQPFSSLQDVKHAYRRLALEHHPDKRKDSQASDEAFIQLATSYNFLVRNKTLYDVLLSQACAGSLAEKVNIVSQEEIHVDEEGTLTFDLTEFEFSGGRFKSN